MHHTDSANAAEIREATGSDRMAVERLLLANALPLAGVPATLHGFFVAQVSGEIVGAIGLERWGNFGLLRSAAVDAHWRGKAIGRQLVERIIDDAAAHRLHALYLLTTTAERYFPAFGFAEVSRDAVPAEIRSSVEFRGACPETAIAMVRPV